MASGVEPQSAGFLSLEAYHEAIDKLLDRGNTVKGPRLCWDCCREVCMFHCPSSNFDVSVFLAVAECAPSITIVGMQKGSHVISVRPKFLCLEFPDTPESCISDVRCQICWLSLSQTVIMSAAVDATGHSLHVSSSTLLSRRIVCINTSSCTSTSQ